MRKKLLSIDGGGIRGIIACGVLKEIESIVCKAGSNVSCLADYFDFIAGTSTGSIIAAGLSKGMKVQDIWNIYINYGKEIFQPYWQLDPRRLKAQYNPANLENKLKETFGDISLGSTELKTLLMITTKNIGSGSTWFFTNNEHGKFYATNKELYIRDLLRASSAAPTFFPPHSFKVGGNDMYFIDGGVSSYNNPSIQLLLEATQKDYGIGWETGHENLQLISIGTGFARPVIDPPSRVNSLTFTQVSWIGYVIGALMEDANLEQNMLIKKMLSKESLELNDFTFGSNQQKTEDSHNSPVTTLDLFKYHRYTTSFTRKRLEKLLSPNPIDDETITRLQKLDCVDLIELLGKIGSAIAKEQVKAIDFSD
jgi:patatin-like phospholipase/acyl hydrolase